MDERKVVFPCLYGMDGGGTAPRIYRPKLLKSFRSRVRPLPTSTAAETPTAVVKATSHHGTATTRVVTTKAITGLDNAKHCRYRFRTLKPDGGCPRPESWGRVGKGAFALELLTKSAANTSMRRLISLVTFLHVMAIPDRRLGGNEGPCRHGGSSSVIHRSVTVHEIVLDFSSGVASQTDSIVRCVMQL
jgi:hypothetical protein